jgi:hypothetical protein
MHAIYSLIRRLEGALLLKKRDAGLELSYLSCLRLLAYPAHHLASRRHVRDALYMMLARVLVDIISRCRLTISERAPPLA